MHQRPVELTQRDSEPAKLFWQEVGQQGLKQKHTSPAGICLGHKLITNVRVQMPDAGKCKSDTNEHGLELFLTSLAKWFYKAQQDSYRKTWPGTAQPSVVLCLEPVLKVSEAGMLLI